MARTLTPKDGAAIMNLLYKQATGLSDIATVDASNFVSVGEKVLATGTENVINSLTLVIGRTLVASRPYEAKLKMMQAINSGMYSNRIRKISYYSKGAKNSGAFNTDLFTNLKSGYTNGQNTQADPHSTKSMWEINLPVVSELNFGGSTVYDHCITVPEEQLKSAFRSVEDFTAFANGFITEHENDIQSVKEAFNRLALINKIASVYDMSAVMEGSVINLTSAFNTKFGTSYTSAELRTTYLKEFLAFFVSQFKLVSDFMTERSNKYHWSIPKTVDGEQLEILRHTPKSAQRAYLYEPLFVEAQANVLPEIFNTNYLDLKTSYEPVTYWQSIEDRAAIKCTPAVTDTSTGLQKAGTAVDLPYVVGMITDVDGLMTDFQLERVASSPLEARKLYRNTWLHIAKNIISDNSENCVIFIMKD